MDNDKIRQQYEKDHGPHRPARSAQQGLTLGEAIGIFVLMVAVITLVVWATT